MVPGSTLMYGSSFCRVTRSPRASSNAPSDADASPLPIDETTPPVTKINLVFIECSVKNVKSEAGKAKKDGPEVTLHSSHFTFSVLLFFESGQYRVQVPRGVHTDGLVGSLHNLDPVAVLKDTQLLQLLGHLQVGRRHLGKLEEELPPVYVKPHMLVAEQPSRGKGVILQIVPLVTEVGER